MTQEETNLIQRAAELRQAFDRSFAEAPSDARTPTEGFLAISAGSAFYALRLSEISGLYADKKIVPLPSESADLLGLASFRGALIPVYDLSTLLGYSVAATSMPRWLVTAAPKTPIGLAFNNFDGYFSVTPDAVAREVSQESRQPHITEAVRSADQLRPVVSLISILESIKERAQPRAPRRGR